MTTQQKLDGYLLGLQQLKGQRKQAKANLREIEINIRMQEGVIQFLQNELTVEQQKKPATLPDV